VLLAHVPRRQHPAGEHDQHARSLCARRHRQRVAEVLRPVGLQRRGRAHGGRQHHGPGRRQQALQQPGRLLQRIGTVGDHDALHLGAREVVSQPLRQPLPAGVVHVLAVELRELLGLDRQRRGNDDAAQEFLHAQFPDPIADVVVRAGGTSGDGAAGPQQHEAAAGGHEGARHERDSG
jgi:hypothetical protein